MIWTPRQFKVSMGMPYRSTCWPHMSVKVLPGGPPYVGLYLALLDLPCHLWAIAT